MLRYKINKISQVSSEKLSVFYKEVYKKRHKSLTNNWRWWYRIGHSPFEPLILSIDEQVIGQAGLLPADLKIEENIVPAIWFVDFAILKKFQGKGFGKILVKEWMKICPNQITFCNDVSLKVFKKLGWKNNLSNKRFVKPINYFKLIPIINQLNLNFANQLVKNFLNKKFKEKIILTPFKVSQNYNIIKDSFNNKIKHSKENCLEILRDESWLKWRLLECPFKDELYFFEFKNSFAVVRIYNQKKLKRLNILYQYSTDESSKNEILNLILIWSINNNVDLIWAINKDKKFNNFFTSIFNKSINFASWSENKNISDLMQKGIIDMQGIDSDVDSSLFIE